MKLSPKAQASIERVIQKFQTGDLSPITKVARIKLDEAAPSSKWSLSNRILAFIQADELDCRGFKQWEQAGRKVKKGSKAVYIFRPHTIKKKDDEGEEKRVCIGFSAVPVFAASSTEGNENLPGYTPQVLPPLLGVAKNMGVSVSYAPLSADRLGDCNREGTQIRLATHDERVFFHELAHAMHAKIEGDLEGGQQVDQEAVAELTAAVLMDLYGLGDNTGNAWRYIEQYADDPLTAITKALSTVEKVLALLIK